MRLRRQDDANFTNRTRWLARRIEAIRAAEPAELAVVSTGDEFLRALVEASRRGPIGNLVVYGHAAPNALFMREDRGFYGSVEDVARETKIVEGTEEDRASQLRAMGARDLADLMELVATGDIRFAKNAVIFFAGCGVAGRRSIELGSIAARAGRDRRRNRVRLDRRDRPVDGPRAVASAIANTRAAAGCAFCPIEAPERLNTRVIDALKQMNFGGRGGGERAAARSAKQVPKRDGQPRRIELERAGRNCCGGNRSIGPARMMGHGPRVGIDDQVVLHAGSRNSRSAWRSCPCAGTGRETSTTMTGSGIFISRPDTGGPIRTEASGS